jgi:hypothetical protein
MARDTTMLELVTDLTRYGASEDQVIAAVTSLVGSGAVRLCGIFKGSGFEGASSWQADCSMQSQEGATQ